MISGINLWAESKDRQARAALHLEYALGTGEIHSDFCRVSLSFGSIFGPHAEFSDPPEALQVSRESYLFDSTDTAKADAWLRGYVEEAAAWYALRIASEEPV